MMAFTWQSSMDVAKSCLSFADKVNRVQNMMHDSLIEPCSEHPFSSDRFVKSSITPSHMLCLGILSPDAEA
jgi:hypothetical protein